MYEACLTTGYRTLASKSGSDNRKNLLTICPSCSNLDYLSAVEAIQRRSMELGYNNLALFTFRDSNIENSIPKQLESLSAAGVIFLYQPENIWLLSQIEASVPTVLVCDRDPNITLDSIELNSYRIGEIIANHLIDLGHERIAYLAMDLSEKYVIRRKRLEGIKETYRKNGYDPGKSIRICTNASEGLDYNGQMTEYEAGFLLTNRVIENYDVTALVGNNDMVCVGIVDALQRRKMRIPQDYSVLGCDNTILANLKSISLTTIENYTPLRVQEATDILVQKIKRRAGNGYEEDSPIRKIKMEYEPRIVIRSSTGPAKLTDRK